MKTRVILFHDIFLFCVRTQAELKCCGKSDGLLRRCTHSAPIHEQPNHWCTCGGLLNIAVHTEMAMPEASHMMESSPNSRRTTAPRHSMQTLRHVGIDCAHPQVARAFRIVLQRAARQAGGTGKGYGGRKNNAYINTCMQTFPPATLLHIRPPYVCICTLYRLDVS